MITAKDIRASLAARMAPTDVTLPDGLACKVRLLSATQLKDAEIGAHSHLAKECKAHGIDLTSFVDVEASALDLERRVQMLALAFVQEVEGKAGLQPVYPIDLLRGFDSVFVNALYEIYLTHQDSMGAQDPIDDDMLDTLVAGIVDDDSAHRVLGRVSPKGLRRVIRAMASRLREADA